MEKLEELRNQYAENEAVFKIQNDNHYALRQAILSEVVKLAKYKVGDKIMYKHGRYSDTEQVTEYGIIAEIKAIYKYGKSPAPQYAVHKINKDGSMHKTANLTYGTLLETDIELVK